MPNFCSENSHWRLPCCLCAKFILPITPRWRGKPTLAARLSPLLPPQQRQCPASHLSKLPWHSMPPTASHLNRHNMCHHVLRCLLSVPEQFEKDLWRHSASPVTTTTMSIRTTIMCYSPCPLGSIPRPPRRTPGITNRLSLLRH